VVRHVQPRGFGFPACLARARAVSVARLPPMRCVVLLCDVVYALHFILLVPLIGREKACRYVAWPRKHTMGGIHVVTILGGK
jgi:hypothetical protein